MLCTLGPVLSDPVSSTIVAFHIGYLLTIHKTLLTTKKKACVYKDVSIIDILGAENGSRRTEEGCG